MLENSGDAANFTMLFGCDPQNGVKADTEFIEEFIKHISSKFDPKMMTQMFPNCLSQIEQSHVKFESVTNNLGRSLMLARQND